MKRIISLLIALSIITGCLFALSACGAPADGGPEIAVYLGEEVYDFDPTDYYVDSNADQLMSLLFEPLFWIDSGNGLKNGMASGHRINKNEREIVITLRESYWSDEIRVTADDFIFSWRNLLLEPNNPNPAAALLYDIENAKEIKKDGVSVYELGAVATGTYELTIKYREGADPDRLLRNLASVATSPVREDIVTSSTEGYWTKVVNSAVTNGPFRIEELDYANNSFSLARNLGYHQAPASENYTAQVTPNTLAYFTSPDNGELAVSYADIEAKTVFYMSDAPLADRSANKSKATVVDDLSTYTYVFNTDNPLFAIEEVRQALSMAIDRDAIINAVTFGKAATGFIPASVLDPKTNKSFRTEDLISTSAKRSEAEALLESVNFSGINKSFTLTVNNDHESVAIAELVEEAWEDLGFNVTVKKVGKVTTSIKDFSTNDTITVRDSELQTLVKRASRGDRDFDVIGIDFQMYSTDPFVALSSFSAEYSGAGVDFTSGVKKLGGFGGYTSADYDRLIGEAYAASDKETRSAKLHEAEKYLIEAAAVAPIMFNQSFYFASRDLSGIQKTGHGNFVFTKVNQKNYRDYLK